MLSSTIKQRIVSTYAQYNDGTVELEARFGKLTNRGFVPGVTRETFNRIRDYFSSSAKPIVSKTTDYISGNVRKTVTTPVSDEEPKTIWIEKTRLWNQEDEKYGVRYSTSREIPIQPVISFKPEIIREKLRYSFYVFKNLVRVDMTVVNMVQGLKGRASDVTKYEVEIELVQPMGLPYFEKAISVVLHKVLDTAVLYDNNMANSVISYVNRLMNSNKHGIIDHYPLVQARNLKLKDMVWGGLIGNESTGYSVTHKADGKRKLLVFHTSGIWLIMAPHTLNRLYDTEIPALTGTILDGEMIESNNRLAGAPEAKYWYLAFDCLSWSGDNSVQMKPHGIRMNHAQAVADKFKTNLLFVNTKSFKNFTTPNEFYAVMREMFREQPTLSYQQDGFMFTPANTIYNPHSDSLPLYQRVLTKYPDICKWKPQDQLTIDFSIEWKDGPEGKYIQLYVNDKGKKVIFAGTKAFPYDMLGSQIDSYHQLTTNLPNGSIVEYGWDYDRNLLIPHRVRYDKTKPNKMDIAVDVWMDINNPLTKETMTGDSSVLLRRYHNRVKTSLLSQGEGKTLLDIGSGRGGDVAKWKQFSKIVAVEPNLEHIEELKRRIELHKMSDKVKIVHAGGEDTAIINQAVREFIGDRVDVISMMLSMSFFWSSQEMVQSLINTIITNIKRDGKFVFLTIDGDLVEQTFEPAFNTGPAITRLELGEAVLTYDGDKKPKELHIHIEGTIVQDQTEWLVRLGDLSLLLKDYGFDFTEKERADKERFLSEEEIIMTNMYTYGTISSVDNSISLPNTADIKLPVLPKVTKSPKVIEPIEEKKAGEGIEIPSVTVSVKEVKPITVSHTITPPVSLPPATPVSPKPLPSVSLPPVSVPSLGPVSLPPVPVSKTKDIEKKIPLSKPLKTKGKEKELPIIPEDTYEELHVSWYPNEKVVRIGAIGDGSCFFHSTLNGYYPPYQNLTVNRREFVRKLRRDLAYALQLPDPHQPDKTNYETASGGQFVALYEQQLMGLDFGDVFGEPVDFSMEGLQELFNSNRYLGNEVYQYAADMMGIDIYVTRLTDKDLYVYQTTAGNIDRNVVVISGNGVHYETVGVERDGKFQTVFSPNDPFVMAIKDQYK